MAQYYDLKVYDRFGEQKDWAWVQTTYGDMHIYTPDDPADVYYELVGLAEAEPSQNLYVTVLDENGAAVIGQQVLFYWPDGPEQPGTGWLERGLSIPTVAGGAAEFPMGPGAGYDPATMAGPHAVWVRGEGASQMVDGIGWLWGTNHRHLNLTFRRVPQGAPPPPSGEYEVDLLVYAAGSGDSKPLYHVKGSVKAAS